MSLSLLTLPSYREMHRVKDYLDVHAASGAIAGALSTTILHPLDLMKTRLQATSYRHSLRSIVREIVFKEGGLALYQGLVPSLIGSGGTCLPSPSPSNSFLSPVCFSLPSPFLHHSVAMIQ
jgi:hypothetical protein